MKEKIKIIKAEVFNSKNEMIKKGLVTKMTNCGAYVYDPRESKNEPPDSAEWFAFRAPNGCRCVIFED